MALVPSINSVPIITNLFKILVRISDRLFYEKLSHLCHDLKLIKEILSRYVVIILSLKINYTLIAYYARD